MQVKHYGFEVVARSPSTENMLWTKKALIAIKAGMENHKGHLTVESMQEDSVLHLHDPNYNVIVTASFEADRGSFIIRLTDDASINNPQRVNVRFVVKFTCSDLQKQQIIKRYNLTNQSTQQEISVLVDKALSETIAEGKEAITEAIQRLTNHRGLLS
jgi:hypothetical protein